MDVEVRSATLIPVAAALAIALALAPVVRMLSTGINDSIGQAWPFSFEHCHVRGAPGCEAASRQPSQARDEPTR